MMGKARKTSHNKMIAQSTTNPTNAKRRAATDVTETPVDRIYFRPDSHPASFY